MAGRDDRGGAADDRFDFGDLFEGLVPEAPAAEAEASAGEATQAPDEDLFDLAAPEPQAQPTGIPDEVESLSAGGLEIEDFYAGFNPAAGMDSRGEVRYEGVSLDVRNLFAPVEELLHVLSGDTGGVALRAVSQDAVYDAFARGLVEVAARHGAVTLVVGPHLVTCDGKPVLRDRERAGSGVYRLYAAGVQTVTVVEGVLPREGLELVRLLVEGAADDAGGDPGDVVRWFWDRDLGHVRLSVLETFDEVAGLPDTALPVLPVQDQAVEQMTRLRSRLLAAVPGLTAGRDRATAVRSLVISRDDLRALEQDLLTRGARLIVPAGPPRTVLPFPAVPDTGPAIRDALDKDGAEASARHTEALLTTLVELQDAERTRGVVDGIVALPREHIRRGRVGKGLEFLERIHKWGAAGDDEARREAAAAILARASAPDVLGPVLDRFERLDPDVRLELVDLLNVLPCQATATLGIRIGRGDAPHTLVTYFNSRLAEEQREFLQSVDRHGPEQLAGLVRGAAAVQSPATQYLVALLVRHEVPAVRAAVADACVHLMPEMARPVLFSLLSDDDPSVRGRAVAAIEQHGEGRRLADLIFVGTRNARWNEWLFPEKRRAFLTAVRVLGDLARPQLEQLARRPNRYRRRSLSETRSAALLALAHFHDAGHRKLVEAILQEKERRVVQQSARLLGHVLAGDASDEHELQARIEATFRRYDNLDETAPDDDDDEAAVRELSPQLQAAMRVDDVVARPGDPRQVLGTALVQELSKALRWARGKRTSSNQFTIAVGRAAGLAAALAEEAGGSAALQSFESHFFIDGRRLRLPFETFQEIAPLREVLQTLRVQELLFAEPPRIADVLETVYALVTAMKVEREPWTALEREFTRVRLRELSLVRESWGRPAAVAVDVRANAARIFGMTLLWLDDVSRRADDLDLLPAAAERLVREITDADLEVRALLEGLLRPKDNPGDPGLLVAHGAFLAAAFARHLGARRDQIASVVRTALYRQVGLLGLPRPLLEDLGAEGAGEALELRRTPLYSAARLAAAEGAGQALALQEVCAFESPAPVSADEHRRFAYLRARTPLAHARVLAVVERYAYLTSSFPRRPALSPDAALARMLADPELDRVLVKAFANLAAMLPAGARVRLSDGREGIVVAAPLRISPVEPLILRITRQADGQPAGDPLLGAPQVVVTGDEAGAPRITGVETVTGAADDRAELAALVL